MIVDFIEQLPANAAPPLADLRPAPAPSWFEVGAVRATWLETVNQLEEAWDEARHADWGGSGETALSRNAVELAEKLLFELRDRFPPPGIVADPQGGVAVEWHFGPRRSVAATISNEGMLYYSVLEHERRETGAEPLRHSVPAPLFAALSRLQGEIRQSGP